MSENILIQPCPTPRQILNLLFNCCILHLQKPTKGHTDILKPSERLYIPRNRKKKTNFTENIFSLQIFLDLKGGNKHSLN